MSKSIQSQFTLRRLSQIGIDVVVMGLAFALAYWLRFEGEIPGRFQVQLLIFLPWVVVLRFILRQALGLHPRLWRYVNLQDVMDIILATSLGTFALFLASGYIYYLRLPWGVLAHDWWLNIAGLVGVRTLRRVYVERRPAIVPAAQNRSRILLVGAGHSGNLIAKELSRQSNGPILIGFVDDDRDKLHTRVGGLTVLGTTQDIAGLLAQHRIDEIVLCMPSASKGQLLKILDRCRDGKAKVKLMPGLRDFMGGTGSLPRMREVQVEDLLNRTAAAFDAGAAASYLANRVVMIAGAGGSLGSELCRQVATLGPRSLLLVGRGEHSLYAIEQELRESFPALETMAVIADVRDVGAMEDVFRRYRPMVVFHAATHKQIPLMERNPAEAVLTNVEGTRTLVAQAEQHGVETFVLLSTDKASQPTNVMGATQRLAELIVQEAGRRGKARFMGVRFGNVLGSRGSVIPLFKRQVAHGGPITVTHPDVLRFFVTHQEAVQRVLEAGSIGRQGEVFVMEMGEPIRIVDLARHVIRLAGFEPDVDIKIAFTGLRTGEKLLEESPTAAEGTAPTRFPRLYMSPARPLEGSRLAEGLEALHFATATREPQAIRRALQTLVDDYEPQEDVAATFTAPN